MMVEKKREKRKKKKKDEERGIAAQEHRGDLLANGELKIFNL